MLENASREFRPALLPRRGEWTAWGLFLVVSLAMAFLQRISYAHAWAWLFWGFLLFSALSISLGNWMDRKTFIRLEADGVYFENGLRRVRLVWSEVQQVAVLPAQWGRRIQVIGRNAHFAFRTLGEMKFQGEVQGRTGFAEGQAILETILHEAGLRLKEKTNNVYYYERD
ncbi:MAG: hypothetical protein Fur0043_05540 [Anaerolineales bacterium]